MRLLTTSSFRGIVFLLAAFLQQTAKGQHPEVLVVYNNTPGNADSLAVANHYMTARNIPSGNLCAISPPVNDFLATSDYITYVKTPIQNCLNAVGQKQILYIVMCYLTPYEVQGSSVGPFGEAAVDSYLSDIWDKYATQPFLIIPNLAQPYYADSQSQGNVYSPFQSFAAYRANARNPLIYSVWRLDGPSAAIASALVDQAMAAEASGGPSGQACIDTRQNPTGQPDFSYTSGDWDLYQAATFLQQASPAITVTEDFNPEEFGTPPAPLTCPDTAYYSGWYSFDDYNNAFTWQTGSVGWHLDSASAANVRTGPSWVVNALQLGIAVTSGAVGEPYLQGLTRPGGAFRNLLEGASVGDAFFRNTRWIKWQILYLGDPLYKPFGSGRAPFSPLQPVNSFELSPQEIVGGANSTGTITLSAAAPAGGTTFTLTSPSGSTVPATVTVAGGATKASFPITTTAVSSSQANIITAASATATLNNSLILDPLLGSLVSSLSATMAGLPVSVTVVLNDRAPAGGAVIALSSDNSAVMVPTSVTVPAGLTSFTFTAGSTPVSSAVTANITGTYGGASTIVSIAVVPAISSMGASPSTISAGGFTVISATLGILVPPGYSATVQLMSSNPAALPVPASFTVPAGTNYGGVGVNSTAGSSGNVVTITATYGGATAMTTVTIN